MTRRRIIVGGLVVVLTLFALVLLLRRPQQRAVRAPDAAPRVPRAPLPDLSGAIGARLPWQFEAGRRRVAGVVRAGERPAAGARVEARPWQLRGDADGDEPLVVSTDAAGRFDLGELPAGTWVVAAAQDGWVPASVRVHSHDPDADPAPDALVIALGACAQRVRGRVADVNGRPIAGAQLRFATRFYDAGVLLARSGADGSFEVCTATTGDGGVLVAWAPGYERLSTSLRALPARLELRLFAAAAIEGVVVDREGRPVEGALVEAHASAQFASADNTAVSAGDGSFRIDHLGPGKTELSAEHPDHGSSAGTQVQLAAGTTTPGVTIELTERCRRLAGVARLDGQPVAGARLLGTFTRADGSFVARCQPTEAFELHVAGYLVKSPTSIAAGETAASDLVVELGRGAVVHGRVTADGKPAAGAEVTPSGSDMMAMRMRGGDAGAPSARADADGRYRLAGLPTGTVELQARSDDQRRSPMVAMEITSLGEYPLDLALAPARLVSGVVHDADGHPVEGVKIVADDGQPDDPRAFDRSGPRASSGADGRFELRGLDEGRYTVQAMRLSPAGGVWPTVELIGAGAHVEVELRLAQRAGRAIAGTVRYADGSPGAGARIALGGGGPLPTTVEPDGSFRIADLVHDRYNLRVLSGDGATTELKDVRTGDEHVAITLHRPGAIDGTIASSAVDWDVRIRRSEGKGARSAWASDVRGARFLAAGLTPGSYTIRVSGPAGDGTATAEVHEGETVPVTVAISASGTITGAARVFPSGAPAAGLECFAGDSARASSDAAGAFTIHDAPPGQLHVRCFDTGGDTPRRGGAPATLAPGGSATVEIWVVEADMRRLMSEREAADLGADLLPVEGGVVLAHVVAGGPAAQAGLVDGDLVVTVDGAPATGARAAAVDDYISARVPGSQLELGVRRGGTEVHALVTLAAQEY